jgi:hypothetical protein
MRQDIDPLVNSPRTKRDLTARGNGKAGEERLNSNETKVAQGSIEIAAGVMGGWTVTGMPASRVGIWQQYAATEMAAINLSQDLIDQPRHVA